MSTTNPTQEESTATPRAAHDAFVARHERLGRDREGYTHHLDRDARRVYRFDDTGTLDQIADLDILDADLLGDAIETYIHEYVAAQVGWEDRTLTNRDLFPEQLP
jgi:hypothetical protein